jgi:predicted transposase/invertase (TIGR01784 family)
MRNFTCYFDELQIVKRSKYLDLESLVMDLCNGTEKGRLNKNSQAKEVKVWFNNFLFTSNDRLVKENAGEQVYNRVIDLEMQTTIPSALEKRVRYYQSVMDISELEKGKGYDEVKDSYVVFICLTDPFNENFPIYTVKQTFEENPNLDYNDGRHIIFFNASAYKSAKSKNIMFFLEYLSTKNSKDDLTSRIHNIVFTTKSKEEFGRSYMIANMREIMMKKQAFNEGLESGILQSKYETAKNLLHMGLTLEQVAQGTQLPMETVIKLKEELANS